MTQCGWRGLRLALIGATAAPVTGGVWLGERVADPERSPEAAEDAVLREIETSVLARVVRPVRASFSGVLEPRRSIRLYAETRGPVIEADAEDLDRVEAGQLLVRIDPLLAEVKAERTDAAVVRSARELALARSAEPVQLKPPADSMNASAARSKAQPREGWQADLFAVTQQDAALLPR